MECIWNCQQDICLSFNAKYKKSDCENLKKSSEDYWARYSQNKGNERIITEANFKECVRAVQNEIIGSNIIDIGVIAANIASKLNPKLTEDQEAFFIAGFQECAKCLTKR